MKRFLRIFMLTMLLFGFIGTINAAANRPDFNPVADEVVGAGGITWMPKTNYARLVLTVNRPDGTVFSKTFTAGSTPYIDLSGIYGEARLDGSYSYELMSVPVHGARVRKAIETAGLVKQRLLQEPTVQTGYFRVRDGVIVTANTTEKPAATSQDNISRTNDEVIYDDLIVDGSLCVGNDCYSGYAFGFDTIVLMENNLRI
jgi:hypothetical protein